jgi:hypothetical protein
VRASRLINTRAPAPALRSSWALGLLALTAVATWSAEDAPTPRENTSREPSASTPATVVVSDADIPALLTQLRQNPQRDLYYDTDELPPPLLHLIELESEAVIIERLAHDDDPIFHFNLTIILASKLFQHHTHGHDAAIVARLVANLSHEQAWVRTESVWALNFTDLPLPEGPIRALLLDRDANVRHEAAATWQALRIKTADRF